MEKNVSWAIKCSDSQMVAYRETLKALGYPIYYRLQTAVDMNGADYLVFDQHAEAEVLRGPDAIYEPHKTFDTLEEFLVWYFAPELTAEQKQILELEATIKQAQLQIEQLKKLNG